MGYNITPRQMSGIEWFCTGMGHKITVRQMSDTDGTVMGHSITVGQVLD